MGKIRKKYTEEQIAQILKEAEVSNERFGYAAQVRNQRFVVLPLEGKIRRNGLKEYAKASRA